jgi:hypothetical protein
VRIPRITDLNWLLTHLLHSMEDPGMNLTIRDQPIFEDESQAKQAMDDMANTLRQVSLRSPTKQPYTNSIIARSAIWYRQTECRYHPWPSRRKKHGICPKPYL